MPKKERLEAQLDGLFAYAFSLSRNRDMAKDLVQDAAERALRAKTVPEDTSQYRVWLFKVLRNVWIDNWRRRRFEVTSEDIPETTVTDTRHEEKRVIDSIALQRAYLDLSEDHRAILSLVDINGMTYEEAAETLSIPTGTVMSRVARARRILCSQLLETDNVTPLPLSRRTNLGTKKR